jgi:putative chitinase
MRLTIELLALIAGGQASSARRANMQSIVAGLDSRGEEAGLTKPHRLAQYIAQVDHESGGFKFDKEVWDGKGAQARYDTRTDLGNTPERDGDGKLYRGRTAMQLTGKSNYTQFRDWCFDQGLKAPDFVAEPDRVNEDPWEGLVPIWFWSTRNLNRYADDGNIEMVTRRINGGTNGLADRIDNYERAALVLLGFKLESGAVATFQKAHGLVADDIAGPKTRAALHIALKALDDAPVAPVLIPPPTSIEQQKVVIPEREVPSQAYPAPTDLAIPVAANTVAASAAVQEAVAPVAVKPLTPLEQMNKPVAGAQAGTGGLTIGGAVAILMQSAGWFPDAWSQPVPAMAVGILAGGVSTLVASFIGAYLARDKRFQA